jgi:hypothetical protein
VGLASCDVLIDGIVAVLDFQCNGN